MIRRTNFTHQGSPPDPKHATRKPAGELPAVDPKAKAIAAEPGITPIRADHAYSLADFCRRTGLGRNGFREAKRKGLPVRVCGRNRYVLGEDWHEFLRQQPPPQD
jgi:hypothetical protein